MWLEGGLVFIITVLLVLIAREFLRPAPEIKKPEVQAKPKREIVDMTREELSLFKGDEKDLSVPIYIAVAGDIYDVSEARRMYGPGASYHVFTGGDASYGLGTSSLDKEAALKSISDLSASEKDTLYEWKRVYDSKYPLVGKLVD